MLAEDHQKEEIKMSVQDNLKLDEEEIAAWNAHDVERALAIFPGLCRHE